jgi:hypothetical protein
VGVGIFRAKRGGKKDERGSDIAQMYAESLAILRSSLKFSSCPIYPSERPSDCGSPLLDNLIHPIVLLVTMRSFSKLNVRSSFFHLQIFLSMERDIQPRERRIRLAAQLETKHSSKHHERSCLLSDFDDLLWVASR